jgi:hypothetical protein
MDSRNEAGDLGRAGALVAILARHRGLTVELIHHALFKGLTVKAAEAVIADAVKRGLVRSSPCVGNRHVYSLTEKGAAMVGLGGACFRRPPGAQAIHTNLLIAHFFLKGAHGHELMTTHRFKKEFPKQAALPGSQNRYFVDHEAPKPRLTLCVPDLGACAAAIATKARKISKDRWKYIEFTAMMMFHPQTFSLAILTPFATKAERVRELLAGEKCHHTVHHVESEVLTELFMFGSKE